MFVFAAAPSTGENAVTYTIEPPPEATTAPYLMQLIPRPNVVMSHGHGSWLYDENGKRYLDFVQGWAVNVLGHAPGELAQVLSRQASRLLSASPAYYTRELLQLSAALCAATGMDQIFLANSGAEANDAAIKLARKWAQVHRPGAARVVTTIDGFHGRTLACVSASGKPGWDTAFPPMLDGFDKVPFAAPDAVERAIGPSTCAVMVEPIQGEAGVVVPPPGYLRALRDITTRAGVLLIFDEIQTGCGRTGTYLRAQAEGVTPDILTLGKGLGGGVPIAALLSKAHAAAFRRGDHGGTYTGNPLTAACASALLDVVAQPSFLAEVRALGDYLEQALARLSAVSPVKITGVRGAGLLWAIELDRPIAEAVRDRALELGLLLNAPRAHLLRFMPQLRVKREEIDLMQELLLQALQLSV